MNLETDKLSRRAFLGLCRAAAAAALLPPDIVWAQENEQLRNLPFELLRGSYLDEKLTITHQVGRNSVWYPIELHEIQAPDGDFIPEKQYVLLKEQERISGAWNYHPPSSPESLTLWELHDQEVMNSPKITDRPFNKSIYEELISNDWYDFYPPADDGWFVHSQWHWLDRVEADLTCRVVNKDDHQELQVKGAGKLRAEGSPLYSKISDPYPPEVKGVHHCVFRTHSIYPVELGVWRDILSFHVTTAQPTFKIRFSPPTRDNNPTISVVGEGEVIVFGSPIHDLNSNPLEVPCRVANDPQYLGDTTIEVLPPECPPPPECLPDIVMQPKFPSLTAILSGATLVCGPIVGLALLKHYLMSREQKQ
ncbi:twin-arginine translocation signal domain-containing protein [Candidatus Microgenomates bacterium]|nr:twin-arginine translocation signal domain-containing protein [Candidatus Microgenomates bacterium]